MKCTNQQCMKEIGDLMFCPYCGTKQEKPKVFCGYCGAEMDHDAVYCNNCGKKSFFIQQKEEEETCKREIETSAKAEKKKEKAQSRTNKEIKANIKYKGQFFHSGPLFPAWHERSEKHGYIDLNGNMVIDALFESAECFSEGLARVRVKKYGYLQQYGYIDMAGNMIIPPQYDNATDFSDGLARVHNGFARAETSFIDKSGNVVLKHRSECDDFHDGLARIMIGKGKNQKYGFIDKNGKYIIKPEYKDLAWCFSEGLAYFAIYPNGQSYGRKYGFLDRMGNIIIQPLFDYAHNYSEGLALISGNWENCGWIDRSGNKVVKASCYYEDGLHAEGDFSDGLAKCSFYEKHKCVRKGFIDKEGNFVIDLSQYYDFRSFSEGFAVVETQKEGKRKFGYINKLGQLIVEPIYDYAWDFSCGLAMVKVENNNSNGSFGYINSKGTLVYLSNRS